MMDTGKVALDKIGFNPNIQGLRGIAAFSVFIFHIYDMSRKLEVVPENIPLLLKAVLLGLSSGVDLFFMISGYLITASLIRHANLRTFFTDRFIRIYPVFFFLHICLFALAPVIKYKWLAGISAAAWGMHFISNMLFLPGVFDLPLMQLNAWSLSYEAAFYILSAAIYFFSMRRTPIAHLLLWLAVSALIMIYPRAIYFGVGTLCFFLTRGGNLPQTTWVATLQKARLGLTGLIVFFLAMGLMMAADIHQLVWLCAPIGFGVFMGLLRDVPSLSAILQSRVTLFMGKISYSFYLWHPVVTFPLKKLMVSLLIARLQLPPLMAVIAFGFIALLITVPVSWLSWFLLEKQVGGWLRQRLHGGAKT